MQPGDLRVGFSQARLESLAGGGHKTVGTSLAERNRAGPQLQSHVLSKIHVRIPRVGNLDIAHSGTRRFAFTMQAVTRVGRCRPQLPRTFDRWSFLQLCESCNHSRGRCSRADCLDRSVNHRR